MSNFKALNQILFSVSNIVQDDGTLCTLRNLKTFEGIVLDDVEGGGVAVFYDPVKWCDVKYTPMFIILFNPDTSTCVRIIPSFGALHIEKNGGIIGCVSVKYNTGGSGD